MLVPEFWVKLARFDQRTLPLMTVPFCNVRLKLSSVMNSPSAATLTVSESQVLDVPGATLRSMSKSVLVLEMVTPVPIVRKEPAVNEIPPLTVKEVEFAKVREPPASAVNEVMAFAQLSVPASVMLPVEWTDGVVALDSQYWAVAEGSTVQLETKWLVLSKLKPWKIETALVAVFFTYTVPLPPAVAEPVAVPPVMVKSPASKA